MAGRFGYASYSNTDPLSPVASPHRVPRVSELIASGQNMQYVQQQLQEMVNRDVRGPAASAIQKMVGGKIVSLC